MACHVELTARAERDLEGIYQRINAEDSEQALDWFRGLRVLIASIDEMPHRGVVTREASGRRQVLYGNRPHIYRVIYAIRETVRRVEVLHIRHGARDTFM